MHRKLLLLVFLILLNISPVYAQTFTLHEAVIHALKVNPSVQARVHTVNQARLAIGTAQSYFWPRMSLSYNHNKMENAKDSTAYSSNDISSLNWSGGRRFTWNLFSGFSHLSNLQRSFLQLELEAARHKQARLELLVNVQLQFLSLLQARESLNTAKESVLRIEKQLEAAEAFVKVDMAPYANVLQIQVELARAQQSVIRANNDIRNAQVQLNRYLGFEPAEDVTYIGNLADYAGEINYTEDEAIKTAMFTRPDLIIAQKSVAVAGKDLQGTLGQFLPRVDATYDIGYYSKDYEDRRYQDYTREYWSIGINFSWEIFSGGATLFETLAGRERIKGLRKEYENSIANARTEIIRSILDIAAAKELIGVAKKGVESARESYAMASTRYMTSIGTITELVDSQLRLTQAETDVSQALTDYHAARARFYYYIGQENLALE